MFSKCTLIYGSTIYTDIFLSIIIYITLTDCKGGIVIWQQWRPENSIKTVTIYLQENVENQMVCYDG